MKFRMKMGTLREILVRESGYAPPDKVQIGHIASGIAGDWDYGQYLTVYYHPSDDTVSVVVEETAPVGGMDMRAGVTDKDVVASDRSKPGVKGPEVARMIKRMISGPADTIKRYGRPAKEFRWGDSWRGTRGPVSAKNALAALADARDKYTPKTESAEPTKLMRNIVRGAMIRAIDSHMDSLERYDARGAGYEIGSVVLLDELQPHQIDVAIEELVAGGWIHDVMTDHGVSGEDVRAFVNGMSAALQDARDEDVGYSESFIRESEREFPSPDAASPLADEPRDMSDRDPGPDMPDPPIENFENDTGENPDDFDFEFEKGGVQSDEFMDWEKPDVWWAMRKGSDKEEYTLVVGPYDDDSDEWEIVSSGGSDVGWREDFHADG